MEEEITPLKNLNNHPKYNNGRFLTVIKKEELECSESIVSKK